MMSSTKTVPQQCLKDTDIADNSGKDIWVKVTLDKTCDTISETDVLITDTIEVNKNEDKSRYSRIKLFCSGIFLQCFLLLVLDVSAHYLLKSLLKSLGTFFDTLHDTYPDGIFGTITRVFSYLLLTESYLGACKPCSYGKAEQFATCMAEFCRTNCSAIIGSHPGMMAAIQISGCVSDIAVPLSQELLLMLIIISMLSMFSRLLKMFKSFIVYAGCLVAIVAGIAGIISMALFTMLLNFDWFAASILRPNFLVALFEVVVYNTFLIHILMMLNDTFLKEKDPCMPKRGIEIK